MCKLYTPFQILEQPGLQYMHHFYSLKELSKPYLSVNKLKFIFGVLLIGQIWGITRIIEYHKTMMLSRNQL